MLLELQVAAALSHMDLRTDLYNALRVLSETDHLRMGELSNRLLTDDSRTTRTVDTLEAKELVTRSPDPNDRRAMLVSITTEGRRRERQAFQAAERAIESALEPLGERDRTTVEEALEKLQHTLRTTTRKTANGESHG